MRYAGRSIATILCVAAMLVGQSAQAAFFSFPHALGTHQFRISFDGPTLPPFAHSMFCVHYPTECKVRRMVFRGGKVRMTMRRWLDVIEVNSDVNHSIIPQQMNEGPADEKWVISPARGDCNDFAVTKRHELIARGWPARALLLAEVVTSSGDHHLVLVVHVQEGDFVADNLHPNVRPWSDAAYEWVRIQTPANPQYWAKVGRMDA
jgi:predicted transglutaminase-like cysteine proteinase